MHDCDLMCFQSVSLTFLNSEKQRSIFSEEHKSSKEKTGTFDTSLCLEDHGDGYQRCAFCLLWSFAFPPPQTTTSVSDTVH